MRHAARHQRPDPKGWEKVAGWYGEYMGKEGGDYQRDIVFPGAERLLKAKKDGSYLDLACGQGAFSKRLAKEATRRIDGFDVSPSLIDLANKGAPKNCRF